MNKLFKNYYQIIQTAEDCIEQHMLLPALILIYTAIDSVSWVASEDQNEAVRTRFTNWVNRWMLKNRKLKCTAEELYAARCGVLHTLTPNSFLSEKKSVRKIAYAWGKAKNEDLEESISSFSMSDSLVSIHLEDLFWSFREGFADYLEYISGCDEERQKFLEKSGQHFANITMEQMDEFLKLTRPIKT